MDEYKQMSEGVGKYLTEMKAGGGTLEQTARQMNDYVCYFRYGSPSVHTWERSCRQSLERSVARRQEHHHHTDAWDWIMRAGLVLVIVFVVFILANIYASAGGG